MSSRFRPRPTGVRGAPIRSRTGALLALAFASITALSAAGCAEESASIDSSERSSPTLLPDLDQETPRGLQVQVVESRRGLRYLLGFRSAVRNIGDGPLIVAGSRPDRRRPGMQADQLIKTVDGGKTRIRRVGRLEYVVSPDHRHWHFQQFDRYKLRSYELRPVGSTHTIVRDHKTGFCLGDRYRLPKVELPAEPAEPVYVGYCGASRPGLLHVREGISVGYGDDYAAFLEGQSLPLTRLPSGRYVLTHRVNARRELHELSYANNAASVLIALRWRQGKPHVRLLSRCPDSAKCGGEPRSQAFTRQGPAPR